MIILHNIHSKESREFVEKYQVGSTIIDWYNDGMEQWMALGGIAAIQDFPSVVIDIPRVKVSRNNILKTEELGVCIGCVGLGPSRGPEEDDIARYTIKNFQWVITTPEDKDEVNTKIETLNSILGTNISSV